MGKARTPEQKAQTQKRRAMEREIYERLSEEERKEYIENRQSESQEKIQTRKNKVKFFQECVKRGIEYARKNRQDIHYFEGSAGATYGLCVSAIRKTAEDGKASYYQVGYTFKKPSDGYSRRVGRGISAYRVTDGVTHPYQFRIGLKSEGSINPDRLRAVIQAHIAMDVLSARIEIPAAIGRDLVRGSGGVFLHSAEFEAVAQARREQYKKIAMLKKKVKAS